jgi:methyltransferase (TIGR00027 family)
MDLATQSRTAYGVAIRRASHQLYEQPPLVLNDPVAVPILGPSAADRLEEARLAFDEPGNVVLRAWLVARSRYAEDKLAEAVAGAYGNPVTQYVLLGAGLDTFAHRNPHPSLRVFEVDHPATQAWKRQLADDAALPHPPSLTYAPCNFEHESLPTQLAAAGFDPAAPTLFALLGVVMYLTLPAFRDTLSFIAARPPGSGLVFDYSQPHSVLSTRERIGRELLAARVARAGEPFQLHFTPPEAAHELNAQAEFFNLEDLGAYELNSLYFANRPDVPGKPKLQLFGQSARLLSAWL